jgi:hypothetical protein
MHGQKVNAMNLLLTDHSLLFCCTRFVVKLIFWEFCTIFLETKHRQRYSYTYMHLTI